MRLTRVPGWQPAICFAVLSLAFFYGCETVLSVLDASATVGGSSTPADGLREALSVGTTRAVSRLGAVDGYLGSDSVRLELPEKLELIDRALRVVGREDVVAEFVTSMNRAAEAAAPLARQVFLDAIREMTFDDAMTILRGDEHEATDYLASRAGPRLEQMFGPIVERKLDEVGATKDFNELMDRSARLPFVRRPAFDLGEYVTSQALDGLFSTLAAEEQRIGTDPLARTTELLRRYFGD